MSSRAVWEELSCFESHDYVAKWFKSRHDRSLNSARIKEIASCFTQGAAYHSSAKSSPAAVRPLLLYYGTLSLARGIILLLNSRKSESSLKPSHGLEVVNWTQTFSGGISKTIDLEIRSTNGTFTELVDATKNKQFSAWYVAPHMNLGQDYIELNRPKFLADGSTITFDDLVSRDSRFLALYKRTTGRPSKVHLAEVVADSFAFEVNIFSFDGLTQGSVSSNFSVPQGASVTHRMKGRKYNIPNLTYRIPGGDLSILRPMLPVIQYQGGDGMFVSQNFANEDKFSDLARTFLLSYFMGMLVRYFPSKWISLLRNDKGDSAQPLLMAAMNAIEADFPRLSLQAVG